MQTGGVELKKRLRYAASQEADWITGIIWLVVLIPTGWVGLKFSQTGWFVIGPLGYVFMVIGWGLPALILLVMLGFMSAVLIKGLVAEWGARGVASATFPTSVVHPLVSAKAKISSLVGQHLEALARKRLTMVSVDHYGVIQVAAWNKEVQYFADKVVRPVLSESEANAIAGVGMSTVFQELVETRVAKRADEIEAGLSFDAVTSPLDFERWCAQVLGQNGWRTTVTKASGDQGADVLAEKDEQTVVLQCKLYTGAVGNKAVQEAFSAQRHYATRRSAVVTNAQFTKSAQELARTTKVLLLHYSYPPGECRLARSDGG
jgi:restriction system protein